MYRYIAVSKKPEVVIRHPIQYPRAEFGKGKVKVHPDFGESVTIKPGEVPVFWPCGVTPQSAIMNVKPEIAITHSPGHMFITDIINVLLRCHQASPHLAVSSELF